MFALRKILNKFTGAQPSVTDAPPPQSSMAASFSAVRKWWGEAKAETKNTRDSMILDQYAYHPIIVVGEMMRGLPKHHLLPKEAIYVGKAYTVQSSFTLWKKKLGKESLIIPIRSHIHPKASPIRGELYFVPTSEVYKLDRYHHNHVFFKRRKIAVTVPYSERIRTHNERGETVVVMREGNNLEIEAWIYTGMPEYWDSHLDAGFLFGLTERFFPNKSNSLRPYFSATINDFSTDRSKEASEVIEQRPIRDNS